MEENKKDEKKEEIKNDKPKQPPVVEKPKETSFTEHEGGYVDFSEQQGRGQ